MTLLWINVTDYPKRRMQGLAWQPRQTGNLSKIDTALPGADLQVQA
jgi:hypothetical protein